MPEIQSLTGLLSEAGAQLRVFDLGRRVTLIPAKRFAAFETFAEPYPLPLQRQAWLGVLGWTGPDESDRFVWFLKFPLDELGYLSQAALNDFLHQLMEDIGGRLAAQEQQGEELSRALESSPYGFKPKEDRMAVFHASCLKLLGGSPTRYYQPARQYLAGELGYDQWQFVGLQGLADVAARLDEQGNERVVQEAVAHVPAPPLAALCGCLENEPLSTGLSEAIVERARRELEQADPDAGLVIALLRALSHAPAAGLRQTLMHDLFERGYGSEAEFLAALAGRCWEDLKELSVASLFLESLARLDQGREAFRSVMADLMFIPGMREPLMAAMRAERRSPELADAMGSLFGAGG